MILVQIATALAVGVYVVLSKDAQRKRLDATPRESLRLQHSVDYLLGAQMVVGDLLDPSNANRVVTMSAVAREVEENALINMSQMTVSEMSSQSTTPSRQQRQHWLSEQALVLSGLPVTTIRPIIFLESLLNASERRRSGRKQRNY
jgi:uncharacterized protein YbjT (DUF2867 family)